MIAKIVLHILGIILTAFFLIEKIYCQDSAFVNTYGGNENDQGRCLRQTIDGGYIIAGSTNSKGNSNTDVYLLKIDSFGKIEWSKTYGGTDLEWAQSVEQNLDSGFIIAGFTNAVGMGGYDMYVVRTDKNGDTLWTKSYGGTDWDFAYSVQPAADGGFIIAGETYSFGLGNNDMYIVKTDGFGNPQWSKTYGGEGSDFANQIRKTLDGGYIIAGASSTSINQNPDLCVIKITQTGDTTWTKKYGGDSTDIAYSIHQSSDGTYIVAGNTKSFGAGKMDFYLLRLNSSGDTLWTNIFGGTEDESWYSVSENLLGNYIMTGYSYSTIGGGKEDVYLFILNKNGNYVQSTTFGGAENERGYSIAQAKNGGYAIVGSTLSYGNGFSDVYFIKTKADGLTGNPLVQVYFDSLFKVSIEPKAINNSILSIFPNPSSNTINFLFDNNQLAQSFRLFNAIGTEVITYHNIESSFFTIRRANLSDGQYYYTIEYTDLYSFSTHYRNTITGSLLFISK